jgi:AcrR family transcriptional regulator
MSERKEEILSAAKYFFMCDGSAATISKIAERAQVTEQTIFRLFGSKEGLQLALFELFWDKVWSIVESIVKDPFQPSARDKIRSIVDASTRFLVMEQELAKAIIRNPLPLPEDCSEGVREKRLGIRKKHRAILTAIDSILEQGQDSGEISDEVVPQVLRQILFGSFMLLLYGLFVQFKGETTVGYGVQDAKKGIEFVLNSLSRNSECARKEV